MSTVETAAKQIGARIKGAPGSAVKVASVGLKYPLVNGAHARDLQGGDVVFVHRAKPKATVSKDSLKRHGLAIVEKNGNAPANRVAVRFVSKVFPTVEGAVSLGIDAVSLADQAVEFVANARSLTVTDFETMDMDTEVFVGPQDNVDKAATGKKRRNDGKYGMAKFRACTEKGISVFFHGGRDVTLVDLAIQNIYMVVLATEPPRPLLPETQEERTAALALKASSVTTSKKRSSSCASVALHSVSSDEMPDFSGFKRAKSTVMDKDYADELRELAKKIQLALARIDDGDLAATVIYKKILASKFEAIAGMHFSKPKF